MLEVHFPAIVEREPEKIAIHFSASTEPYRAAVYWQAAGDVSMECDAVKEARQLYRHALQAARESQAAPETSHLISEIEDMLASI